MKHSCTTITINPVVVIVTYHGKHALTTQTVEDAESYAEFLERKCTEEESR